MGDEKWVKIYNRNISYDENLDRFSKEFLKVWTQNRPSPHGPMDVEYQPIAILGAGSFGVVKLCKHKKTNKYFAVKVLVKNFIVKEKQINHVKLEKRILAAVCFPFLVHLEFSTKDNACLYLGLPFINGGELFTYHQRVRKFPERQAKFYAVQVFLALEYLHYLDIVYRDLKTENILIDAKGYLKVTDFGFCKKIDGRTWTLCGTPEYLAPEIIKSKPYGKSVDWWSYGVLCYEFVAGYTPFRSNDTMVMYERICNCNYKIPGYFSKELKLFLTGLLQVDVTKRLGALKNGPNDIRELEWIRDTNWKGILGQEIDSFYIPKLKGDDDISNFDKHPDKLMPQSEQDLYQDEFAEF